MCKVYEKQEGRRVPESGSLFNHGTCIQQRYYPYNWGAREGRPRSVERGAGSRTVRGKSQCVLRKVEGFM